MMLSKQPWLMILVLFLTPYLVFLSMESLVNHFDLHLKF